MQSALKSEKQIDIKEFYSLKIRSLWKGFKQEHISFWFLCIYFLFEYIRPQVQYPIIDILPWGLALILLTTITAFTNKTITWVSNPINKLFVIFILIIVLSGIFAFNPVASWDQKQTMLGWVIVYFLVINIVNTEKLVILFILAYLLFSLKMAQFGTLYWVRSGFSFSKTGLEGAPGWFRNSGEYAIQMLIYGSLAISVVISLRGYWGKYKKWILYACAIMGYLAVMGASSRGSQLGLAVIVAWFMTKQKNGFKGLVVITVLSLVLYYFLPEKQMQRFEAMGADDSSLQRLAYWKAGVEIIKQHPVLGVGYENWISYMLYKYPDGVGPYHVIQVCHNIYIQAASELGLIGLFCFLAMIVFAFKNNLQTRRMAKQLDNTLFINLSYGLDAGLIGYLVAGTFVTVLYYPFFWVQIAMIVMVHSVTKQQWLRLETPKDKNSS